MNLTHLVLVLRPILAALVGLFLGVSVTYFAGEDPFNVLRVIFLGGMGTPYAFGLSLFFAVPLIFCGLAVALPFKAGLFNVGAEGQLYMGAMATVATALLFPEIPAPYGAILAGASGFVVGGLWGGLAGWLRAYRGSHEVIACIMLNFVASGLTSYAALYLFPSLDSQNPESREVNASYMLPVLEFFDGAPLSYGLLLAPLLACIVWFLLAKTSLGFAIRVSGSNPDAARLAGINSKRLQVLTMVLAGGMAGLVGIAEVLTQTGRFRLGFSPDYGFIAIPVALLARSHPIGLVISAVFFGVLQKGTAELDLETTYVTRDLAAILQAMVMLCVSAEGAFSFWHAKKKSNSSGKDEEHAG